ncbi:hypothetical protein [Methylocystis echinoides]|uniref:hypothetical protein n=1 Tax=Methylocystis echinoides TaxID=29468 RepID=UPI0034279865
MLDTPTKTTRTETKRPPPRFAIDKFAALIVERFNSQKEIDDAIALARAFCSSLATALSNARK